MAVYQWWAISEHEWRVGDEWSLAAVNSVMAYRAVWELSKVLRRYPSLIYTRIDQPSLCTYYCVTTIDHLLCVNISLINISSHSPFSFDSGGCLCTCTFIEANRSECLDSHKTGPMRLPLGDTVSIHECVRTAVDR